MSLTRRLRTMHTLESESCNFQGHEIIMLRLGRSYVKIPECLHCYPAESVLIVSRLESQQLQCKTGSHLHVLVLEERGSADCLTYSLLSCFGFWAWVVWREQSTERIRRYVRQMGWPGGVSEALAGLDG